MNSNQRFADLRWAGFLPQMLMRSTELCVTTKLSTKYETPPIANVLLAAGLSCQAFRNSFKLLLYKEKSLNILIS